MRFNSGAARAALLIRATCLVTTEVSSFVGSTPARPLLPAMMARTPSSSQPFQATASADADVLGQTSTPSMLMDDILRGNSTAASTAVEMLMEVRGTETMEDYLGEMLPPQRSDLPLWARMSFLARFSRRARQLRLSKLLELSTPSTDGDQEEKEEDGVSTKRRARRSLFVLLRTMANNPDYTGVSSMLAMAKRDAKDNVSSEEMLKRTPDLETPNYEVLKSTKGGFEVRRYDKFSVCSVTMNELKNSSGSSDKESASKLSNPQLSGATSFGALAGYLFGKNEEQTAMKMTTPVFSEGEGSSRTMSFVLPSDYWQDEGAAPKPLSDSVVRVSSVDGCDRAVLAFPGFGRKTDVETRSSRLREILESDKDWRAVDDATVLLAQYNDPFTPPWKRRNEVSLSVEPRQ